MKWIKKIVVCGLMVCLCNSVFAATVLVEAESFKEMGGWVVDQQSMDQMGSPYLMAHGLGVPVADAHTTLTLQEGGNYRVLIRTRNWVASWGVKEAPGIFRLVLNGRELKTVFGNQGCEWSWQEGERVQLSAGEVKIGLRDLTGFNGRCDAILLTTDDKLDPPVKGMLLAEWRKKLLGIGMMPEDAGEYDLVVVGGGIAGCCAAVSAARLGCRVAVIQDRPLLGGNNSSEVRVGLSGLIHQEPYPRLGDLVDELGPVGHWNLHDARKAPDLPRSKEVLAIIEQHPEKTQHNAGPASNYEDERKFAILQSEQNITLFVNTRVIRCEKEGSYIKSVTGRNILDSKEYRFRGRLFADCTGDANLGFMAGADYRMGREAQKESEESLAPEEADMLMMGVSVQWYAEERDAPKSFPECSWALTFNDDNVHAKVRGDWDWEAGLTQNSVTEIEQIRDYALRAAFGNWTWLKNHSSKRAEFTNHELEWVAYIGGKRESRRLLGDIILKQQDIQEQRIYEDACVTVTWPLDLHYPHPENLKQFPEGAFRSVAKAKRIKPYPIPYRTLYSRNIDNMFMAGRNISVTHVALGTVRVMRTTGMMGEVVGMAAAICTEHQIMPRGVFDSKLEQLKEYMERGVGK